MAAEKRVNPQVEVRDEASEGAVTVMSDLGPAGPRLPEVEVDRVAEPTKPSQEGVPMVVIRVNEDVEEMTWVAGNHTEVYTFEAGTRYRVPIYIARELENVGKIWH